MCNPRSINIARLTALRLVFAEVIAGGFVGLIDEIVIKDNAILRFSTRTRGIGILK
jgi:hypothetical protein